MKKFYKFKHKRGVLIAYPIVAIILLICVIVNFLHLFNVGEFVSIDYTATVCAIVILLISLLSISLMIFGSGYRFCKNKIICFFGIFARSYSYEKILAARVNDKRSILLIYHLLKDQEPQKLNLNIIDHEFFSVCIKEKEVDLFVNQLRENNQKIDYQIINEN